VSWWLKTLAIAIGGGLGSTARYWLSIGLTPRAGASFPWATLTINVSGSFVLGALFPILARWAPHPSAALIVLTGFLGGYTTFSTFAVEALRLGARGSIGPALLYLFGSPAAGLAAAALGALAGSRLAGPPPS